MGNEVGRVNACPSSLLQDKAAKTPSGAAQRMIVTRVPTGAFW
jgi:hypothetical protein